MLSQTQANFTPQEHIRIVSLYKQYRHQYGLMFSSHAYWVMSEETVISDRVVVETPKRGRGRHRISRINQSPLTNQKE